MSDAAIQASPVEQALRIEHFFHFCHHCKIPAELDLRSVLRIMRVNDARASARDKRRLQILRDACHFTELRNDRNHGAVGIRGEEARSKLADLVPNGTVLVFGAPRSPGL